MSTLLTSEIIRRLALGELSNLKMAEAGDGTLSTAGQAQVLVHLNHALKDIFTRFLLSKKELIINTDTTITHYYLRYQFAQSNDASAELIKYIDDSACEDWDGRVAKILDVYDEYGRQLYMNKKQEPLSVFTPVYDCVQITANHTSINFYVIFQALHPLVTVDDTPTDTVINIPPALEKALVLLTASKVYVDKNGEQNLVKSAQLNQEYETALLLSEFRDTNSASENMSNGKLDVNGFV